MVRIIFLLLGFLCCSQTKRFVYEYTFIKDSLNKGKIDRQIYYLDSFSEGSVFYDFNNYVKDSVATSVQEKIPNFSNQVLKTYPAYSTYLVTKVYDDFYKVYDERRPEWTLTDKKMQIGDFHAQSALLHFGGRNWTAWFTKDIPIQDGPYKFYGLPGLILRVEDSTGTHLFELTEILNIGYKKLDKTSGRKLIPINRQEYSKLYKQYRKDPIKNWIQKGIQVSETDNRPDGDFLRNMRNYHLRRLREENNILEIDLLK